VPQVVLEPVDAVEITALMDNVTDVFMPDQGPARRPGPLPGKSRTSAIMAGGRAPDALIAEHGFSTLVDVRKGASTRRVLLEMSPQVLVPAHCTGWRAQHAMARRFGEAFIPNTVGSRFRL
jgi:metal-dependent hydrolase (beta-lactamase superfamily II)